MMEPLFLHQRFNFFNMKFIYILSWLLFFIKYSFGQVVPHGLINKKEHNATSIASYNGAFQFNYDRYPAPRIQNNTNWSFNANSAYTFQFEIQKHVPTTTDIIHIPGTDYSSEMPIIGFTTGELNKNSSVFLFTIKTIWEAGQVPMEHNFIWYVAGVPVGTNKDFGYYKDFRFGIYTSSPLVPYTKSWHFTITYNNKTWRFYVNGIKVHEYQNVTYGWTGSGKLIIGSTYKITKKLQPKFILDEFRFWDRALDGDEIAYNWNKSLFGNENGLKIYYNFNDQGRGNENNMQIQNIIDKSLNNNNATLNYTDLINDDNNFVSEKNFKSDDKFLRQTPFLFKFDANNYESYPGTNKHNNPISAGKLYNLIDFENNLQFYTNTSYNQVTDPFYHIDGGRSLGIYGIYGKSIFNSGISGGDTIRIEAWVQFNSINNQSIFSIGENYNGKKFEIAVINKKIQLDIGGDTLSSISNLIAKKWYYITLTYVNSEYKIFLNDILETTGRYVGPPPHSNILNANDIIFPQNITNTPIYIGKTNSPFDGKISILNIHNRGINDNEVAARFYFNKARFGY